MKYNYLLTVGLLLCALDQGAHAVNVRSLAKSMDEENVQIANIYGIPTDSEKLQIKQKKQKKQAAQALSKKKSDFKKAFADFSKKMQEEDFDKGVKLKQELLDLNVPQDELDKVKINASSIYKKQFSFPEVAKNDFAADLIEQLEISEKNLNSNLDNVDLYNSFVETADDIKKKLKDKYGDQWTDPAEGAPPQPADD